MNRNHQILFNVFLFGLGCIFCQGQGTAKTFKETFNVGNDAVLNINTTHADIEFETWNKDEVEITAVIELEEATEEEAKSYFEEDPIKIVGNSKEIEVSTRGRGFGHSFDFNDIHVVMPDLSFVEPLFEDIQIPELPEVFVIPEMPPMPPIPSFDFDYDAYKKDGDKYMKEWKKNFNESFNEEYQERFEEWGKRVEEMAKERSNRKEELRQERKQLLEERNKLREEALERREEVREQRQEAHKQRIKMKAQRDLLKEEQEKAGRIHTSESILRIDNGDDSNTFYFSSGGENRKYKVKKRIRIKMPKSVKLKMNVKHGEVKLAANTRNLNASLSYASLLASTIDGDRTDIRASYSPVSVQKWNYGQLKTDYSDQVNLKEVKQLKLNSISSHVIIDRLEDRVLATNNLGELQIKSISNGFSTIDIAVENGEVECKIPSVPFSIYVNETTSDFVCAKAVSLESSKNYNTQVHKGYHMNNDNDRSITINSKYSEVVLKE